MDRRTTAGLLAGLAGLALVGCDRSASVEPRVPPAAAITARVEEPQPTRVVTLAFAGDVHFQLHLAGLLDHPRGALGPIARTLREADLTMVNLESALTDGGSPDPKELEAPADRYWFQAPPAALDVLAASGVDVVTMANNHGADYGPEGLADTLRAVRRGPVPVVGVGPDSGTAFTPYRTTIDDTPIAVLAADASPPESRSPVWEAGAHHPGLAAARGGRTGALLRAVRHAAARDELVVVYLHWGVEDQACPSSAQRRLARDVADAGADVIVGSHAHLQQGAGWLGQTYVDYGLGNFLWYHNHQPDTGVLRLRVEDGHVVSDAWEPAEIELFGRPRPLRGDARTDAIAQWRKLRACTGLTAGPSAAPSPASVQRIGPGLRERLRPAHGRGCPLAWSQLRYLRLPYFGFDGAEHTGGMVVDARYAQDVVGVFARLHEARWPIRQMRPVSDFGGDDDRSMAADNTSAYNCRRVAGSARWSDHALGAAIDINPVENPYLRDGEVRPLAGRAFARLDRAAGSRVPAGAIREGDVVVGAFAAIGWEWGGSWSASPDYQHFYAPRA